MEDWKIDAVEVMDGVVDSEEGEAEAAADLAAAEAVPQGGEESFTLKHLDETVSVGRGRVVELAQKGLDYDRVRAKLESARTELEALRARRDEAEARELAGREELSYEAALERVRRSRAAQTGAESGEASPAERRRRAAREFVDAHPEVAAELMRDTRAIPDRVWERVRAGESLLAAYDGERARSEAESQAQRIRALEAQLAETKQAQTNALRSTGSCGSDGGEAASDPAADGWGSV